MTPTVWLEQIAQGFSDLPPEDREAIFHFTLLWSLFEAKALSTNASAGDILALVRERAAHGRINPQSFEPSLQHFRHRYFASGRSTQYFVDLRLRRNDSPDLVKEVMQGVNNNAADTVAALLIIIYRLRNNLFHGVKWAYGIKGQRENFEFASSALMAAYDQLTPRHT